MKQTIPSVLLRAELESALSLDEAMENVEAVDEDSDTAVVDSKESLGESDVEGMEGVSVSGRDKVLKVDSEETDYFDDQQKRTADDMDSRKET